MSRPALFSFGDRSEPDFLGRTFTAILVVSIVFTAGEGTVAAADRASAAQVDRAIAKAVEFLEKQQRNSNWEGSAKPDFKALDHNGGPSEASRYGGVSALVTYALLVAGESDQTPEMAKAIKWLRETEMYGTYAVALRSQVWMLTNESAERNAARDRDRDFLLSARVSNSVHQGGKYDPR